MARQCPISEEPVEEGYCQTLSSIEGNTIPCPYLDGAKCIYLEEQEYDEFEEIRDELEEEYEVDLHGGRKHGRLDLVDQFELNARRLVSSGVDHDTD